MENGGWARPRDAFPNAENVSERVAAALVAANVPKKLGSRRKASGRTAVTWSDQVAVVTGGARGIGRGIALLLAQRGAAVCVNYAARADAAEQVASEIRGEGGRAITAGADVADFRAVEVMIEQAEAQLGPVTILVNNAGVSHQATLDTFDYEQFDRMRRVNADGIIHTIRAAMVGMRARRYGRIVNVASIAAIGTGAARQCVLRRDKSGGRDIDAAFRDGAGP